MLTNEHNEEETNNLNIRILSSAIWCNLVWQNNTDVSEKSNASIFMIEK
jgi:hypothetical protein